MKDTKVQFVVGVYDDVAHTDGARLVSQDEQDTFNSTVNADKTLGSFCRWAAQINPADEADPHHHDVAVLITRVDICARRNTPCNTLGVAHVGGMCTADRSCSVNQDNGIVLAHTIAHEMGHKYEGRLFDIGSRPPAPVGFFLFSQLYFAVFNAASA